MDLESLNIVHGIQIQRCVKVCLKFDHCARRKTLVLDSIPVRTYVHRSFKYFKLKEHHASTVKLGNKEACPWQQAVFFSVYLCTEEITRKSITQTVLIKGQLLPQLKIKSSPVTSELDFRQTDRQTDII